MSAHDWSRPGRSPSPAAPARFEPRGSSAELASWTRRSTCWTGSGCDVGPIAYRAPSPPYEAWVSAWIHARYDGLPWVIGVEMISGVS
jgi:hypothetical protein